VCALGLAGCGGSEGSDEVEQAEAAEMNASESPVPGKLASTKSGAEDIIASALSGDRGAVVAGASTLADASNGATAGVLSRAGVPDTTVAELEKRTTRLARLARDGSFVEVALAANAVSQLMPSLFRRFHDRVPAEILALDYLDREAQFRSLAGQTTAVAAAVTGLARTWTRVRPKVVAAGGGQEAKAYQAHVAAMKRLSPAAADAIQAEARRGLELVDQLERVFTR
jgi:hypothetical protein